MKSKNNIIIKSISDNAIQSSSIIDRCTNNNNSNSNNNLNSNNDILVYENGTVLGSVILIDNENINNNNVISTTTTLSSSSSSSLLSSNKNCLKSVQNLCDNSNQNINNSYSINDDSSSISINRNLNDIDNNNSINNNISDNSIILNNDIINLDIENNNNNQIELLNSSNCSHDSRQSKQNQRTKIQFSKKSQNHHHQDEHHQLHQHDLYTNRFPPQYTAIYLDANSQTNSNGNNPGEILISDNLNQIQQFDSAGGRIGLAVPVVHRNAIVESGQRGIIGGGGGGIFRKLFRRPSLPFVVGILALGGVACTLGGIVLGSTGLVEHSTQYLSAALLMIGIGVSLLVISGAIWRLTIPDDNDNCPCFRHLETCRNCNSPFCNNRIIQAGFMYPEFQHRPPPPSYLTSLNECTVGLLLHHEMSNVQRNDTIRLATPPPAYQSSNSLSVFVPLQSHHLNTTPTLDLQITNTENIEQITTVMSTVENPNNHKENPLPVEI